MKKAAIAVTALLVLVTIAVWYKDKSQVQSQTPSLASQSSKAEPYVVKGRVTSADGRPIEGAEVWADNTLLYNSNVLGVSDVDGYYRLELPDVSVAYQMGGKVEVQSDGKSFTFDLEPEPNTGFGASEGAVVDFVLAGYMGEVALTSWDLEYPDDATAPMFDLLDVELTLKSIGKLMNGSTGHTIIKLPINEDGPRIVDVPMGSYEVSAVWKPKDYKEVPMLIDIRHREAYKSTVEISFENTEGDLPLVEIDVAFPKE
ncbi:peptidase associated/transthyretin-like domain-containing protein [Paenibacillus sp. strain BS8-2]